MQRLANGLISALMVILGASSVATQAGVIVSTTVTRDPGYAYVGEDGVASYTQTAGGLTVATVNDGGEITLNNLAPTTYSSLPSSLTVSTVLGATSTSTTTQSFTGNVLVTITITSSTNNADTKTITLNDEISGTIGAENGVVEVAPFQHRFTARTPTTVIVGGRAFRLIVNESDLYNTGLVNGAGSLGLELQVAVPEPSTALAAVIGLAGLGLATRARRRSRIGG